MRVQELFESVKQSDVVKVIYALAAQHIKTDKSIKDDIAYRAKSSDEFWSSSIDNVTRTLEKFVKVPNADTLAYFEDSVNEAIEEVANNMVQFYENRMNHAPGYKAPKIQYVPELLSQDKVNSAFNVIPGFANAHAAHVSAVKLARKQRDDNTRSELLADGDAKIKMLAALIDKHWDKNFNASTIRDVNKNPHTHGFDKAVSVSSPEELLTLVKTKLYPKNALRGLASWVVDGIPAADAKPWMFDVMIHPIALKKLKSYSKKLSQFA